ncbi:hypothetical protein KR032_000105, partial [Drosophila birchii]
RRRCNHCEKVPRRTAMKTDSLGSPVGLVCSNATMACYCMQKAEATARDFATYLKAFALIYVLPEVDWTAEKIDMLLEQGMKLYRCSSKPRHSVNDDRRENQLLGIYTNEEKRIKRNFILEGHTFTMALEPRYLGEASRPHIIKNLKCVLQAFFKSRRYGLLLTRVGHLLIWRRRKAFFVLDVKGRRRCDLRSDKDNGVAMLVCLKTIDNVVYLASNLSGITPKDEFTVRELVVVRLKTPEGRIYMRDSSSRSFEFKVVSKSYAYLKATLHLSLGWDGSMKNRSSLTVAVCSILASKIDHPANWDTNMLDRLICCGVELCYSGCCDCLEEGRPLNPDKFPTQLRLGQFVVELKLMPRVRLGYLESLDIVSTDFETNFREALEGFGNVVFQINNQMYAIWVKDDFYYLLDPYRHTIVGTHVEEDQGKGAKWATLRMFRDRLTMLSVFHQLLQQSNGRSAYSLHAVRIRNIDECPPDFIPPPSPADIDACDVESLNEPILFSDELGAAVQDHCLAVISDSDGESEKELDFDLEEFTNLDERKCAGATKSSSRSRKISSHKKKTKEIKRSENSVEESRPRSSSRLCRKSADLPRKSSTKYERDFMRQTGGGNALANSSAIRKGVAGTDKWSAIESAIIRLGNKVAASSLLTQKAASVAPSSPGMQPSERQSISEVTSIYKTAAIFPLTSSSMQSMGTSNSLEEAPMGSTSESNSKSFSLLTDHQAERALLKKQNKLDITELRESGSESLTRYPGYNREPQLLAVAGSESGTVESLNRLLGSAFKVANRVLTMTPWGNYVVFQHCPDSASTWFYLFDGCTCNIDHFRHLDLSIGTAGLLPFRKLSEVVCHMIDSRREKA